MDLLKLIRKLLAGESLTDDERAALEGVDAVYTATDVQKAKDDAAGAARKRKDERIGELTTELEATKAALEKLQGEAGGNDARFATVKAQYEQQISTLRDEKTALQKQIDAGTRKGALDALKQAVGFVNGDQVSSSVLDVVVREACEGVETEHLSDDVTRGALVAKIRAANPGLIAAPVGAVGPGMKPGQRGAPGAPTGTNPFSVEGFNLTSASSLRVTDPTKAKALLESAKASGTLHPTFAGL